MSEGGANGPDRQAMVRVVMVLLVALAVGQVFALVTNDDTPDGSHLATGGGSTTTVTALPSTVPLGTDTSVPTSDTGASTSVPSSNTTAPATTTTQPQPPARPLGTVTVLGPSTVNCASTSCVSIEVACPDVDPARAVLGINPVAGRPRGLVLLFSGGKGTAWWADPDGGGDVQVVDTLHTDGFMVVQARWDDGWEVGTRGVTTGAARLACRPATVVRFVYDNQWQPLGVDAAPGVCGFCISGHSGGASQASYALSMYGLETIVHAAVLTSGPPHAALAKGCAPPGEAGAYRYSLDNTQEIDLGYGFRGGGGPCERGDPAFAEQFATDGVDTGGTDFLYPTTRIHMILGGSDPTVAPIHAQDYLVLIRAAGSPWVSDETIPGMAHSVTGSRLGRAALIAALEGSP